MRVGTEPAPGKSIDALREAAAEVVSRMRQTPLQVAARVDGTPGGLHRGLRRGGGVEFAEHREYSPGDDLRHLDWRAYARNDKYFIKRFEQEVHASWTLLIDASASMSLDDVAVARTGSQPAVDKFSAVRVLGATVAMIALQAGDAVGLKVIAQPHLDLPPAGGERQLLGVLESLVRIRPSGQAGLESLVRSALHEIPCHGVVLALSDVLTEPASALAPLGSLARLGADVVLLQTLHPLEVDFELRDVVEVVCDENGARKVVDPRLARRSYVEMMAAHCEAVRSRSAQVAVHYELAVLSEDPATVIQRILRLVGDPVISARWGAS
jgi:uncharacterized protein (DUF58 family)